MSLGVISTWGQGLALPLPSCRPERRILDSLCLSFPSIIPRSSFLPSFIQQIITESLLHARNGGMSETHTVPCPHESDIRARKTDDKTREQINKIFSSPNERGEAN